MNEFVVQKSSRKFVFLGLASFLVLLSFFIDNDLWRSSKYFHTIIETIATVLALIVGILSLIHFYSKKAQALFLFVGVGFLGTSFLELYHTVVTSVYFDIFFPSPPHSLIPWSWFAARVFLSLTLAYSFYHLKYKEFHFISEKKVYVFSAIFTLVSFILFAFIPLPPAYYESNYFHRPEEFIPAILFLYALVGFYKKKGWENSDFEFWLILSLIVNFISQTFFMTFSHHLFDPQFDLAHILKQLSYIFVLAGLIKSIFTLFLTEKDLYKKLEMTNQKLDEIVNSSTDFIWEVNANGVYTYASPKVVNILGYTPQEVIGKTPFDFISDSDKEIIAQKFQTILENKLPIKDLVNWNDTKDGAKVCLLTNGFPIIDEAGRLQGYRGTDKDITVSKENELKLSKALEQLQQAQNITKLGIWELDIVNNTLYWSDEIYEMFEIDKNKFAASYEGFLEAIHPEDRDMVNTAYSNSLETQKDYAITHRLLMQDGRIKYVQEQCSTEFDSQGNPLKSIGTVLDITKMETYKKEIEELNKNLTQKVQEELQKSRDKDKLMFQQSRLIAMGEMISMIAHQWRQPISTISMEANNLLADLALNEVNNEEIQTVANVLLEQTQYLSSTIDDFKNFFQPKQEKVLSSVSQVLDDTFKVMGKSLDYHNIKIVKELNDHTQTKLYTKELLHVFINLLKNSKDVLLELDEEIEKVIRVRTYEDEEMIYTEIEDNGGGIEDSIIDKIFDPYFTTKDAKNGTGLGLYMSKSILIKHFNASIIVHNTQDGAKFTISIPKENK